MIADLTGQHNDTRMNISLVLTAVQHGAVMANHVEVTKIHKKLDQVKGTERICGARVKDRMTGDEWDVKCRVSRKASAIGPYSPAGYHQRYRAIQ